jgi:hypothetical protein
MANKLQKFLVFLSSLLFMAVVVLLFKIQGDNKKLADLKDNLGVDNNDLLKANQEKINYHREKILNKAAKSPVSSLTQNTQDTTTIIPPPAPATPAPKTSNKKTKTS